MRYLAWILFGVAGLILLASIPISFSYWNVYGPPDSFGFWWSQSWWVLVVAAIPAIAGYLVLRIARDRDRPRS